MTEWRTWFQRSVDESGDTIAAAHYDSDRSFRLNQRSVLERLRGIKGQWILDIGPATGHFCQPLTHDNRVIGVDFIRDMLKFAQGRGLIPVQGDGLHLPFGTASMDVVICVGVLQHIDQTDAFLQELLRVRRPDGQLFLLTLNQQSVVRFIYNTVTRHPQNMHTHAIGDLAARLRRFAPSSQIDAATLYYPLPAYQWVGVKPWVSQYLSTSILLRVS